MLREVAKEPCAVCKGKISEGLNFKDKLGRLVIVIGIPFSAINAPKVRMKKEFMNKTKKMGGE